VDKRVHRPIWIAVGSGTQQSTAVVSSLIHLTFLYFTLRCVLSALWRSSEHIRTISWLCWQCTWVWKQHKIRTFIKKMLPHPSVLGITYSLKPSTHLTQNKINAKNKIFFAAFTLLYFRCTDVEKMIRALYTVVRVKYTVALQRERSLRWQMTTAYQPLNRRANTRRKDKTDRHHTIARHSLLWVLPFTDTIPCPGMGPGTKHW